MHAKAAPLTPLVTIAIPTFDRCEYLIEAVESALAQSWPRVEVLVGDDGETDVIPEWCRRRAAADPRLQYYRNPHRLGLAGNWNALANRASGDFILFLGDDDRLLPPCVDTLMSAATPESAVIFCNHHVIDASGRRLDDETSRATRRYGRAGLDAGVVADPAVCAWRMALCPSAALVRRDEVLRLRFRDELHSPDVELFIRLAHEGAPFVFVPEYLAEYRLHGGSMTSAGLRNDRLASRLVAIAVPPAIEPIKTQLLHGLIVNAVSRCLQSGDMPQAIALLNSRYYPSSAKPFSFAIHRICAALPELLGRHLYRSLLHLKQRVGG